MKLWRWAADRIIPDSALADIGKVGWQIEDPVTVRATAGGGFVVAFTITISRQLLNANPFTWRGERFSWRRWPIGSIYDLMPSFGFKAVPESAQVTTYDGVDG